MVRCAHLDWRVLMEARTESQTRRELQQIQQRVLLLNEMLSNAKPNERFVDGDAYDVCRAAARTGR